MRTYQADLRAYGLLLLTVTLTGAGCSSAPGMKYFKDLPNGAGPAEVGKRVSENFVVRKFEYELGRFDEVVYPEICTWYGALDVADLTGDKDLKQRLVRRFDRFFTPEHSGRISKEAHVDFRVIGVVPLEIYMLTNEERHLDLGLELADAQWDDPTPDGITREARYWVDDIYMISSLQAQAYRATGEMKYLDRAARTVVTYLDKLQQSNGLFHHAPDSPFFWSRGNGWYAAGMTELLRELPKDHPDRPRIMKGYRTMMAALLKYQSKEGLWRQLVDKPESWLETSGSGMFCYAMITGVTEGWLEAEKYGPAARAAWLALVDNLDDDANMQNVCVGTNKAALEVGTDLQVQLQYYIDRERSTGDYHGQAPILWSAAAILRASER